MSSRELSDEGLPLREALEKYSDPELWMAFDSMKDRAGPLALIDMESDGRAPLPASYFQPYFDALHQLMASFLEKLRTRKLVATGIDRTRGLRGKPIRIPARLWYTLKPDFKDSSAAGGGMRIAGVLIHSTETRYARAQRQVDQWIRRKVIEGAKPRDKKSMLAAARAELGEGFTERAFNRSWRLHAREAWKKPGRKPRRPDPTRYRGSVPNRKTR